MPDATAEIRIDGEVLDSNERAGSLIDSFTAHIAVLNEDGDIIAVNRAWRDFGTANGLAASAIAEGLNYLSICDETQGPDRGQAMEVAEGIREVVTGRRKDYTMEYPCHGPFERRWFLVRVSRFSWDDLPRVIVIHEPITAQKRVEQALNRRARYSAMVEDVVKAGVASNQTLQSMLQEVAGSLVRNLDATFARVWTMDPTGTILELQASAGLYTHINGPHARVAVGQLKIGQIAEQGLPHLTNKIWEDSRIGDQEWVSREGLVSFAGYPLFVSGRLVGVMALFSRKPLSVETLDALEHLANVVGQAIGHKEAELALRESEQRFRLLVDNAADAFFLHDEAGQILDVNQQACESLGYSRDELLGRLMESIEEPSTTENDPMKFRTLAMGKTTTYEAGHRRRDGSLFPIEARTTVFDSADHRLFITVARDVTDRKRIASQLEYQANHDFLTGLPNRSLLSKMLDRALSNARSQGSSVALLLIDLDRFKEINDTFGHPYGDIVLQQLNPRLRARLRANDVVARLGGDEFAILLPGMDRIGALRMAEQILEETSRPIEVEGYGLYVGASIGIALFPEHARDANALLQRADVAMYASKKCRAGPEVYSVDQLKCDPKRLALVADLRQAVTNGDLSLYYQPKIDLRTGQVPGAEALARWNHPVQGMITPSVFIPLSEHTGLIRPMGLWALETAGRECAGWRASGFGLTVAVNLAADNLQDPKLFDTVDRLLEEFAASTGWLTIEVTESTMMADPVRAKWVLNWLHDLGIKVAIDDFGTGYSSLAYLKEIPADEVKIDRSFVQEILTDRNVACITRAVIDLGHNLGMKVVAEGVEDRKTLNLLISWGCDVVQGYYFSRPMPADQFLPWVKETNAELWSSSLGDTELLSLGV